MAGNSYLTDYFREVYQRIFLRHRIEGLHAGRAQEVVLEHDQLFDAIRLKDESEPSSSLSATSRRKRIFFSSILVRRSNGMMVG
jgi:DNA-binding GntR family transcriptional regulator